MTDVDLLIRDVTIVDPDAGVRSGSVLVADGRIVDTVADASGIGAREVIEGRGRHLFPGVIDPHTHIGFAGDFAGDLVSETRSALRGGVTTMMSFHRHYASANPEPYDVDELATMIEDTAATDVGLHFGLLTRAQVRHLDDYIAQGVSSFKFYLAYRGADGRTVGMLNECDDAVMYEAFQTIGRHPHAVAGIHAENTDIVAASVAAAKAEGDDLAAWSRARPVVSEMEGVSRACFFARLTGTTLYLVHLGTPDVIDFTFAQRQDVKLAIETCPHYLTHTTDYEGGALAKINPPIRDQHAVDAVWDRVFDGTVDTIGTDHCAVHRASKEGSMWDAKAGFAGVATMLPVMLSEGYHARGLDLVTIARLTSTHAAELFNLPRKGHLRPGADADLVLVDLDQEWTIDSADLESNSDYSIYDGRTLRGAPVMTISRGEVVMTDGEVVAEAGRGRFLRR